MTLPNFYSLIEMIYPKIWSTSLSKTAKSPLPFGIRRSKTSFLKLPTTCMLTLPFSDFESLKS